MINNGLENRFGKWTPVYVGLPEEDGGAVCVLITTDHNHFDGEPEFEWKEVQYGYYETDSKEWRSLAYNGEYEVFENVTAWMPLPKPFVDKNLESEDEE